MVQKEARVKRFAALTVTLSALTSSIAFAAASPCPKMEVGRVEQQTQLKGATKYFWRAYPEKGDAREIEKGSAICEGDTIHAVSGQVIGLLMSDATEITLSPNTKLQFKHWIRPRKSPVFFKREVAVSFGVARFKVKKVYSDHEPFAVTSTFGVALVRGTDFVFDLGMKKKFQGTDTERRLEVSVWEGQVRVARTMEQSMKEKNYVFVDAGSRTFLREEMELPFETAYFDVEGDQQKLAKLFALSPREPIMLVRGTTNEGRAETAAKIRQDSGRISPASPLYANPLGARDPNRGIASIEDENEAAKKKSRRRDNWSKEGGGGD